MANPIKPQQKNMMIQLCGQLGREVPKNIDQLTSTEAYAINAEMMTERTMKLRTQPKGQVKTVAEAVETELEINPARMGMCFNNAHIELMQEGKIPSEHPTMLLERARKLYDIAIPLFDS